jgi:predicted dehydrogenase
MNKPEPPSPAGKSSAAAPTTSRRNFLKNSGRITAASALAGVSVPFVHAADDHTIRLALIGCGGRGAGAAGNALTVTGGPVKLVAMADLFKDKQDQAHKALKKEFKDKVDVPDEQRFIGFDAYRKAIDCLRPGDVALLTTNSYCRATHLDYAVEKGVNVFMEKSFAPDPGGLHRMLRAGQEAEKKNLKISTGLMCRHSVARQAFIEKVRNGDLGDIPLIRAYRMGGKAYLLSRNPGEPEVQWQIRNKGFFNWVSSGRLIEYMIHQIDEICWLKDAYPVAAHGLGGRVPNSPDLGQNLDTYSVEYTFADGSTAMVYSRDMDKAKIDFATYVHGTKKAGQFSGMTHKATVHTYKDMHMDRRNIDWKAEREPCNPWQAEWNVLLSKIRNDEKHNETERSIYSNFASILGRAAVHYQNKLTWDEVFSSNFKFCENIDGMDFEQTPPVLPDDKGAYPVPIPGQWTEI